MRSIDILYIFNCLLPSTRYIFFTNRENINQKWPFFYELKKMKSNEIEFFSVCCFFWLLLLLFLVSFEMVQSQLAEACECVKDVKPPTAFKYSLLSCRLVYCSSLAVIYVVVDGNCYCLHLYTYNFISLASSPLHLFACFRFTRLLCGLIGMLDGNIFIGKPPDD